LFPAIPGRNPPGPRVADFPPGRSIAFPSACPGASRPGAGHADPTARSRRGRKTLADPTTRSDALAAGSPFTASNHFSLVALVHCEIQAIDQHWSLHRLALSWPDGARGEALVGSLDFIRRLVLSIQRLAIDFHPAD
jgi:hypothetical protein